MLPFAALLVPAPIHCWHLPLTRSLPSIPTHTIILGDIEVHSSKILVSQSLTPHCQRPSLPQHSGHLCPWAHVGSPHFAETVAMTMSWISTSYYQPQLLILPSCSFNDSYHFCLATILGPHRSYSFEFLFFTCLSATLAETAFCFLRHSCQKWCLVLRGGVVPCPAEMAAELYLISPHAWHHWRVLVFLVFAIVIQKFSFGDYLICISDYL